MITVQETTKWDTNTPNHRYITTDDMRVAYAYIKAGETRPYIFNKPMRMDWRGRTYKVLVRTKDVNPSDRKWIVEGSSGNKYTVTHIDNTYRCTCPASLYRHSECKHIISIRDRL